MASLLFGIAPTDLVTMLVVMAMMAFVGAAASWIPAWRASRLDASLVLRAD
jgi:ABC-type lipoprotein release transport system permease subunit